MKIDVHGHLTAPESLYAYKANILSHRGAHGRGGAGVTDESLRLALEAPNKTFGGISHMQHLNDAGIDIQFISPRPYQMMHSEQAKLVEWFTEETNDVIARTVHLEPNRFRGVAGLPQTMETDPSRWVDELRRCVNELGFVGAMLNPDPYEGVAQPPSLGERFWYPVWEALTELDVPVLIHSAGCRPPARESYSLHFIQEETLAVASLLSSNPLPARTLPPARAAPGHDLRAADAQAVLRHLPLHPRLHRAAAGSRRRRPLPVRLREAGHRIVDRPGDRTLD
jgi:predicted TIM-barrel fold metal-dependent hydrolase